MMKIVSGKFGGRRLITPKNNDIRPTSDKIRGAVFNMLGSRGALNGCVRVLDAFCGTGALGLEAISRGANHCTFIDKSRVSLDLAKENAYMLKTTDICEFMLKDASKIGTYAGENPYDLVFLDPPYNKDLINAALENLVNGGWLAQNCWIMCESERSFNYFDIGGDIGGLKVDNEKTYGDTKITLLTNNT